MKSRRERRAEARANKTPFEPVYKSGKRMHKGEVITVGGKPKSYEEMFGVGYERFNNKFVTIKKVEKETETEAEEVVSE